MGETIKIMFANFASDIVAELIPLLMDIGTPMCLIHSVTKVLVLFSEMDKQMIWFNLFVMNPHFMANYYQAVFERIKMRQPNDLKLLDLQQFVTDNIETASVD